MFGISREFQWIVLVAMAVLLSLLMFTVAAV